MPFPHKVYVPKRTGPRKYSVIYGVYHALNLLSSGLHENVASGYKLPVGDGREVLASAARLKYFHKGSHLPTTCSYMLNKNLERVYRKL